MPPRLIPAEPRQEVIDESAGFEVIYEREVWWPDRFHVTWPEFGNWRSYEIRRFTEADVRIAIAENVKRQFRIV